MADDLEQLLVSVFRVGEGFFGVPAGQIQEVVQVGAITQVHHAPASVRGIRNLRGSIVSVIDVRTKLNLGHTAIGPDARIMILESEGELIGLLVEAVEETVFLDPKNVSSAPEIEGIDSSMIRGIYETNGHLLALLDHHSLLEEAGAAATRA